MLNNSKEISKGGTHVDRCKRIKKGVTLVIIFASILTASNAALEMQHTGAELALARAVRRLEDDEIEWETYEMIRDTLELDQIYYRRLHSVVSGFAKVLLIVGFIPIILGFLSITFDRSFHGKLRRLSLVLTAFLLIGMLYLILSNILTDFVIEEYYYRW